MLFRPRIAQQVGEGSLRRSHAKHENHRENKEGNQLIQLSKAIISPYDETHDGNHLERKPRKLLHPAQSGPCLSESVVPDQAIRGFGCSQMATCGLSPVIGPTHTLLPQFLQRRRSELARDQQWIEYRCNDTIARVANRRVGMLEHHWSGSNFPKDVGAPITVGSTEDPETLKPGLFGLDSGLNRVKVNCYQARYPRHAAVAGDAVTLNHVVAIGQPLPRGE